MPSASESAAITTSLEENPFYVLDLRTSASPKNVEKQKQKLLGMLELGLASAKTFSTPIGDFARSEESIRRAAAALENPSERLGWELWVESLADSIPEIEDLGHALGLHYDLQKRALEGELEDTDFAVDINALSIAWDAVFDGELLSVLGERTQEEHGVDGDDIFNSFSDQVTTDLAELIEAAPAFDLDDLESEVGIEAADRICRRASELLESSSQSLLAQFQNSEIGVQRPWRAFKTQHRTLTAGRGHYMRVLSFDAVYDCLSDLALEVYEEEDYIFAETLFLWLRDEADAVGSDEISEQHAENARIAEAATYEQHQEADSGGGSWFSGWGVGAVVFFILIRLIARADCDSARDYNYQLDPEVQERIRQNIQRNSHLLDVEPVPIVDGPTASSPDE